MAWQALAGPAIGAAIGALGSRGGGSQTTTTEPWSAQQPYLRDLLARSQGLLQSGQLGQVIGFTPLELQSQQMLLDLLAPGGPYQHTLNNALSGYTTALNAADVNANPYLSAYAEAALRPIERSLMQNVLPSIRSEAGVLGNYGGSRQGIAEGIAIQDYNQTAKDLMAQIYSTAYGQGLQAQQGAFSLLPTFLSAQAAPAQITGQVGGQQRAMQQAQADAPYRGLTQFQGLVSGNYGGTTTQPGTRGNPMLGALGGAILGTQLPQDIFGTPAQNPLIPAAQASNPGWGSGAFSYAPD